MTTQALAERLDSAYSTGVVAPIAGELSPCDIPTAYAVQMAQVARWQASGRRVAGRKIGITSFAVQRQLDVDTPDFGHVMADMIYGDGDVLPYERLQQPRAEAEVALILDRDIDVDCPNVADIVASTGWVMPALEIVGSRIADWKISIFDTIADNASSNLVVLGGPARRLDGLDLSGCAMTMELNGETVSSGRGSDCLGNPLNAAVWLARAARDYGSPLRKGEVILTGALGPMVSVAAGDTLHASIGGLGTVSTSFSNSDQETNA
ncbi:2-keto-4-pentenoate hydratase [Pacificimonas flava]|uniref:2-keto-4-pentenoate hydratase n=2 Tax=Pacificimonas TaxID=1960290 RepID=A0A219B436_9SPHN|nr:MULTISPECIES: fumarylacetoacetate hydrolase family protein [Pacificimonas]MBZ6377163.1 fumarylacetoacetate hydrolase family protein [Pacificimonas aurantium]OWV33115.1 2-keto-4-pentenoate hydratase [Pacificimonas flava]